MHEHSTAENPRIYRYTSMSRRRNSGKKAARRRRACEVANEPLVGAALVTLSQRTYMSTSRVTYERYLVTRSGVTQTLNEFYGREIFCKLRFRCFMQLKCHEDRLVNDLRRKFGNAVLVFGDVSIGNHKYHPPTPCLGLRDLLQHKGFEILLIDEHLTSSRCPICKAPIQPFKTRESPRPWQANGRLRIVTGLLKCVSLECQTLDGRERLWNRDLVVTMNFLAILRGHRNGEGRPGYLARGNQ